MKQAKLIIGGFRIWIDEDGQPRCNPGSIEDVLPRMKDCGEDLDTWVEAVEAQQKAHKAQHYTAKQEGQIKKLMKLLNCDRTKAIEFWKEDLSDL